jgi:hypothetical protein
MKQQWNQQWGQKLKQKWVVGAAAVLIIGGAAVTGVLLKEDDAGILDMESKATGLQQITGGTSAVSANAKPTLDAKFVQDGRDVTITYTVKNMNISADHVDHAPVQGEGHLHIYVDGKQKAVLKTAAPVKLENLTPGKHTIKLDLQHNNHTPLNVEKIFDIEVK